MTSVEMGVDLSLFLDVLVSGNRERILAVAREYLQQGQAPDVLLGRIAMIAAHGDPDGHIVTTLAAAAMLCRYIHYMPRPLETNAPVHERALPLFAQALFPAIPAVRLGYHATAQYPMPFFPSELPEDQTMNDLMHDAVFSNNALLAERVLFGLYGTGADYRALQARAYEGIATTFQNAGHPLIFAVRGFQTLDAVEWGDRVPNIIHWLAPHLPLNPTAIDPDWVKTVRKFTADTAHSVQSIRKRLSPPKDINALPLRSLILSNADTAQVCQGVYDALMNGEASRNAVGSVISLAAAEIVQMVGDDDRELFVRAAHGLLFSAAVRLVFRQVQDMEVLPLLFTSAAFIHTLHKEITAQQSKTPSTQPHASSQVTGGGLMGISQLETLSTQLKAQDISGALTTAQRYLTLEHDPRALFATISLVAALNEATADYGHTLQIVQAASEEFIAWPVTLASTNIEAFLQVALRAAAFGKRDSLVSRL